MDVGGGYGEFMDVTQCRELSSVDHYILLTEHSKGEVLILTSFKTSECIPRFLLFSISSSTSKYSKLLIPYIAIPPVWIVFAKKTLMVRIRP